MSSPRVPGKRSAYSGEIWTDGHGYATVVLPDPVLLSRDVEYELATPEPGIAARLASGLNDGRFTIESEPHVKVAWRISGRDDSVETQAKREG